MFSQVQPAWAPDGRTIGYVQDGAIWADTDGTKTQLTSGKDDDSKPAWRPAAPQ